MRDVVYTASLSIDGYIEANKTESHSSSCRTESVSHSLTCTGSPRVSFSTTTVARSIRLESSKSSVLQSKNPLPLISWVTHVTSPAPRLTLTVLQRIVQKPAARFEDRRGVLAPDTGIRVSSQNRAQIPPIFELLE